MSNSTTASGWLQTSLQNLSRDGFVVSENVGYPGGTMRALARRTRFELTKFGFSETFFIFHEFESLAAPALRRFSADAFRLAKQAKTIPLPCGLMESVWCFAVAITKKIESVVADSVRIDPPTKHWAAAEIPVVLNQADGRLSYFEKTPLWGAAYYRGFRTKIQHYLDHA